MKKIISLIIIFIVFILIYFLQSNFFSWFNIAGVKPNLFVILVLFIGIFLGKTYGITSGVVMGLLIDFFVGEAIGINAISLAIVGIMRRSFCKKFFKRQQDDTNGNNMYRNHYM